MSARTAARTKVRYIKEARENILDALRRNGTLASNIVSLVLERLAEKYGTKAANDVIDELDLEDLGWRKKK